MKYKHIITALLLITATAALFGFERLDDDPIKKIVTQLSKWTDEHPQEKVYLQTDKPYYAAGESIWFKAYVITGSQHQLSALSKLLTVELIDDKDSLKKALRLGVYNGLAWGDFQLPDSLKAGNYRIRAYTNYMRNAGDEYFFDKTFVIGNAINNKVFTKAEYHYSTQNNQQKVSAAITYTDLSGSPYAGKEVSYNVELDAKNVARGKGTTDASGVLNISFASAVTDMKKGRIETNIKISDKSISRQTVLIKAIADKVDLQFFPEGGSLINGIRSKVAFKATGADGLGTAINGVVKDNENNEIAKLTNAHFGMGLFVLQPESGKTYKAIITNADGSVNTVALPVAVDEGYTLSVINNETENLIIKVGASQAMVAAGQNSEISVVAQQNGKVYYAAKSKLTSSLFATTVPKSRFPSGIVQFTLFSPTGEPLNERVVFIQNADQLKLALNTAQQTYAPRQKVKINLDAKGAGGQPVVGNFSVSVTDEAKVPVDETDETTIFSNLLLTSDLKGYVEKPNYYFTDASEQTRANLDMLMLTQGYRRFVWKQILNDQFSPMPFLPEKSITIAGTIKTSGGKPVPNGKVILMTTNGGMFLIDTVADQQGKFAFHNLVFGDSIRFVIQARTDKNHKNVDIALDNIAPQAVTRNKNNGDIEVNTSAAMLGYLQSTNKLFQEESKFGIGNHSTMLKEVVVNERPAPLVEYSNNLNGPGSADQVVKAGKTSWMDGCPILTQCLQGRLTGVVFKNGVPYMSGGMQSLSGGGGHPMLLVLDGVKITDAQTIQDLLSEINPRDIETIEVLRTIAYTSIYGSEGGGGVIIITSKHGGDFDNDTYEKYSPGLITYSPRGYYKTREFYSPQYDDPKTKAQMADLRSTIFWKPNVVTNKEGSTSFDFFNADNKGTYRVVVEGIDGNGNLGRQVFRYKVE